MVSFSCEVCNDTLAKKKLMGHYNKCPNAYFTCIDCNTTFDGLEFQKHTQCISEDQKYQGKLYKPKEQKKPAPSEPKEAPKKAADEHISSKESKQKKVSKDTKDTEVIKVNSTKPLRKVLKSLEKKHNMDKKSLLKHLQLTPEGFLQWAP